MSPDAVITVSVLTVVVILIAADLLEMSLAAMLGVSALTLAGIIRSSDVDSALHAGGPTLVLLAGGMVLVRILMPTGLFERLGGLLSGLAGGDGRRFVISLIFLTAPLCAVLPNATVVLLMAPAVIIAARRLQTDPIPPVILLVAVANSAGLLTLVGDPATFVVGHAINLSFAGYLRRVSLGGLLVVLALVPIAAILFRSLWRIRVAKSSTEAAAPATPLKHRGFVAACLTVFALQVLLFVVGEDVNAALTPPFVAFLGASTSLLVLYGFKVEPMGHVLRDLDWGTLLFIGLMFILVQALVSTGALNGLADLMLGLFGQRLGLIALLLLIGVAAGSSLVPNVPMVAAMVFVTKSYLILGGFVPEEATGEAFANWPDATLPVFIAMMFGATLGGNATMIGAASNLIAVGVLKREGCPVDFKRFARYGVPLTALQIGVAALFLFWIYPRLG